jgi:hypothetical protein
VAVGAGAGGRRWPAAHGARARGRSGDAGRAAAGAAEPRRWAVDPVAPLLAALALLAEALIGYVLAMGGFGHEPQSEAGPLDWPCSFSLVWRT